MQPYNKTLVLFSYDWDQTEFARLQAQWPHTHSGFDLFTFPSNARLAWYDMEKFANASIIKAKILGAKAVVSNHEQFGALNAALIAEKMGWHGTSVNAVLACQHKLYAREVLQQVAPEANLQFAKLDAKYGGPVPDGLNYPAYVKPVKAAFSVLACKVNNQDELHQHTRFAPWELWVIRHLVEPFERLLKQRLPEAGTAHSLMLETPTQGDQYCLDGYVFDGKVKRLGVVDSVMYPGTDAFMRFDYPSRLPLHIQQRAEDVARRFFEAIDFDHGLFNMEFFYNSSTDKLTVIEFNPRMASQFSDLYRRVHGLNLHEMALALGHGIDPSHLPLQLPTAHCASSFVYRSFDPRAEVAMPSAAQRLAFREEFPDALLFEFPKLSGQIERDFKWLRSYRYGIVHLGGANTQDLRARCEKASAMLGWKVPYADKVDAQAREPWPKSGIGT
jgi:hypothetical protein